LRHKFNSIDDKLAMLFEQVQPQETKVSEESRFFKKLQVIVNPAAGIGRPVLQALNSSLKE